MSLVGYSNIDITTTGVASSQGPFLNTLQLSLAAYAENIYYMQLVNDGGVYILRFGYIGGSSNLQTQLSNTVDFPGNPNGVAFGVSRDGSKLYAIAGRSSSVAFYFFVVNISTGILEISEFTIASNIAQVSCLGTIVEDPSSTNLYFIAQTDVGGGLSRKVYTMPVAGANPTLAVSDITGDVYNDIAYAQINGNNYLVMATNQFGRSGGEYFFTIANLASLPATPSPIQDNNNANYSIDTQTPIVFVNGYLVFVDQTNSFAVSILINNTLQFELSTSTTTPIMVSGFSESITNSSLDGNLPGNSRYFVSDLDSTTGRIRKLYGPNGTSVGGDPHVSTFDGKSFIISGEEPFLFLDTHPSEDSRVHCWCDSFNIFEHLDWISEQQAREVDNAESYLKTFYIKCEDSYLELNMVTLEVNKMEGEWDLSPLIDCSVDKPIIKSAKYQDKLLLLRRLTVEHRGVRLYFEFLRTSCLNYSDVYVHVSGKDVFEMDGVIVRGVVKRPLVST
jgi:hypothetical protein